MRTYSEGPLLWLGEEFEGFRLTHVDIRNITFPSGSGDMTTLIYGDCDGEKANPREPSCMSPLQIQIKPAGATPPVETLKPSPPQPSNPYTIDERRGLPVYEQSWNIVVEFANGQTATILNQVGNNAGLVEALRSANHDALGVPAAQAGEPLVAFTSLPE